MTDVELAPEEVEVGGNIYDNQNTFSDKNEKKSLTADLAASTVSSGGDLVQVMEDSATLSAEEMKTKAVTTHQNDEAQLLSDTIEFTAATDPAKLPNLVEQAPAKFKAIEESGLSKLTPYKQWVNSIEGSEKLSEDEKTSIAIDSLLLESITSGSDKRAWYEDAWDVLGMMALPDESYNAAELQANLFGDKAGFTDWLGSEDAFTNIAKYRESLSNKEKLEFDETLIKSIKGVDDNVLQQIGMVMGVLGRDPDTVAFQALEKVDALFIGGALGRGLYKGLRSLNVLNRTAKAGDARAAAKMADVIAKNSDVAIDAGVPQMDAATVGNPVKAAGVFTGAPEGIQQSYRRYQGDVTEALQKASDTLVVTAAPDSKDAEEIAAAVKKNLAKNDDMDNIEVELGVEGVIIKYDVLDVNGVTTVREERLFTLDDLGGFEQKEAGFIASGLRFAVSPNTLAGADRKVFVQKAEAALLSKARTQKAYSEAVDAALKPVNGNKKSLKKIDVVMRQLDGTDTEMTYHKLVNEGVGGQRLTDKEFVAVTGLRRVLDDAWYTNNIMVRREMELRGVKSVSLDGNIQYAKPHLDPDAAYRGFSGDVDNQVIVDANGVTHKGMGLDELKQYYTEGQVLVKADASNPQEWFTSPDGFVKYALVNRSELNTLPDVVLNKVKNYLPKIREDANYFLKQERDVVINGVKRRMPVTIAYGATEGQTLRYLQKLERTAIDAGEPFDASSYKILFDREVAQGAANSDSLAITGGLIRGKRKSTEIDWAGDLDEGGRTDALDSIQRYMGVTADRVAMSEWRLEARARVMNEASLHESIGDKAKQGDWNALRADIKGSNIDPQEKAKLLAMHDQVSTLSNIPSEADQAFQGAVRAIGKKFDRAGREGTAKFFYKMHDKSVTDVMKGITFNLTLGMYNMVQLPVQLFGASVAVSINPIAATKAAPRWLMSSALDFVTNEKTAKQFLAKTAKDQGIDVKTLENDYMAWRKSGMYESVVRGSADASSIANRLPYDAGFLRTGFHRAVELGQTPYRMGELSNMRISFFTALEREKGLKGKAFKYDDATIGRVVSRAEQYRLNMSGANKAAFQKGIWALPTQFKQIYTKYMEAMFGTHFTGIEKARLAVGQMALFGAAGVPMLNHFTDSMMDTFGLTGESLSSEELTTIKRGIVGWYFNHELDIDAMLSGRLTVSADVIEDFRRALIDERTPMFKTMLGASFTSGDKILDFAGNMVLAGNMVIDEYLDDTDGLHPKTKEAAYMVVESLLEIPSSSRKWLAAKYLSEGLVRKADGSPLYSTYPELRDIIARGIGFGSQETSDLYTLSQANFKEAQKVRDLTTFFVSMLYRMDYGIREQLEGGVESAHINAKIVQDMIEKEDPRVAEQIWQGVIGRLSKPRDFKEKTINDSILKFFDETTNSANKTSIIKQKFIEEQGLE